MKRKEWIRFFLVLLISLIVIGPLCIVILHNMQGNISTWWQNVIMGFLILIIVIMQAGLERIKMSTNEKK